MAVCDAEAIHGELITDATFGCILHEDGTLADQEDEYLIESS